MAHGVDLVLQARRRGRVGYMAHGVGLILRWRRGVWVCMAPSMDLVLMARWAGCGGVHGT